MVKKNKKLLITLARIDVYLIVTPSLLQYQHLALHFLPPFDFDLEEPLVFSPLSFDQPLATMASSADVLMLDFLHTSSDKRAPTKDSSFNESAVLN